MLRPSLQVNSAFDLMSGHWWRRDGYSSGYAGMGAAGSYNAEWDLFLCKEGAFRRSSSCSTSVDVSAAAWSLCMLGIMMAC